MSLELPAPDGGSMRGLFAIPAILMLFGLLLLWSRDARVLGVVVLLFAGTFALIIGYCAYSFSH